jgi:hypothetical protein
MIYVVSADDVLIFADMAFSNIRAETLEDTVSFADGIFSNFKYFQISELLRLNDMAFFSYGIKNVAISDSLSFSEILIPRSYSVSASDFLILQDVLSKPPAGSVVDLLSLLDLAAVAWSRGLDRDILTFTDTMLVKIFGNKILLDALSFSGAFSAALINRAILDTPSGYVAPTTGLKVYLQDNVETLTIDNPDFGDSDTVNYKRINRDIRGYTHIIQGISGWLPRKTKKMVFTYLKESEANNIVAFWRRNAGRPVTLTDMYGTTYNVILQNPEFEVAQVGRFNRTLTMDFYVL